MRRYAWFGTLVALACPAPALAGADVGTKPPQFGPVLSGPTAIWAGPERSSGEFALMSWRPGGDPSQVAAFAAPHPWDTLTPSIAASPARLIVSYGISDADVTWGQRSVFTAPAGGEFEQLADRCSLNGQPDIPRVVDVSAEVVAYQSCGPSGGIVARDYSMPVPVDQQIPGARPYGLRIAGRYVAWLDSAVGEVFNESGIVVYDRVLGTTAYHLAKEAMPGGVHDLDLQADGKVAFSYTTPHGMKIAWASGPEPYAHTLSLPERRIYEVRLADDRVGFEGGRSAGAGSLALAQVGVTDLTGSARTLGNLGEGSLFTDDFDFDGSRLAWWSYGCTKARIHVIEADGPAALSPRRSGCRLRFRRKPRIRHGRYAQLFVDCFGFAGFCTARHVILTAGKGKHSVVVGRGKTASRVKLTDDGLARLHARGHLAVRVRALMTDNAGRRELRHGRRVLRR